MTIDIQSVSAPRHFAGDHFTAGMPHILQSPKRAGTIEMIVIRPATQHRLCVERANFSPATGVAGDRWLTTAWRQLADGSPDPAIQVTLMNSRCIELVAGDRSHWHLAGDNLFVDFDLSKENLPVGARLRVGECVLQIASPAHNGCAKFARRFGKAAVKFVNSPEGKSLRLRGVHARILEAGTVAVGDAIERLGSSRECELSLENRPKFRAGKGR
jgi:hypothetical protein